jgi:ribosome-binding factor A
MSFRIDRINELILRTFGEILQSEADLPTDVLVTVSRVETTRNLQSATIWLSVLPVQQAEEVLERLHRDIYALQGSLNRKLTFHPLPRIRLALDYGAQHAERIERRLKELGDN